MSTKRRKPTQRARDEDSELARDNAELHVRNTFLRDRLSTATRKQADAIVSVEQVKRDYASFYEAEIASKDATIARLENEKTDELARTNHTGHGASVRSKVKTKKHRQGWADEMRTWLRNRFVDDPESAFCALKTLAVEDLRIEDLSGVLELRKEELCADSEFLDNAVRNGQMEYRNFLQKHISPSTADNLIKTMLLSRVKYNRLNEKLFHTYQDDADGNCVSVLMSFNGVDAPHLPTRHALDKYRSEVLKAFDLQTRDGGLSSTLKLREVLKTGILTSLRQGFFILVGNQVFQCDGRRVQVMNYTDAANHFKGMKVTASAIQLPDGSASPNSPFHTQTYSIMEGGDGFEDIITTGRDQVEQANDLIDRPNLELGPIMIPCHGPVREDATDPPQVEMSVSCPIDLNFGGDQAHSNAMNCLLGCNCSNPCTYCECSKHDLCSLEFTETFTPRTRERIILLAHAKLGSCPGCLRTIVPKGEVRNAEKQVELAVEGDDDPEVPYDMKTNQTSMRPVTHSTVHFGVQLGRSPPYHLEPNRWIVCLLHLNLCIVRGLFTRTIVAEFGKLPRNTGPERLSFANQIDAMAEMLSQAGLRMKKNKLLKPTSSKEVSHYDERLKNSGLGGRDAQFMMNAREAMLQLMYPESICGPWFPDKVLFRSQESFNMFYAAADAPTQTKYSAVAMQKCYKVRRVWFQWDRTWKLLSSKLDYGAGGISGLTKAEVQQVWDTRADNVYEHAKTFVSNWVSAVQATQGLYLHLVVRHVPDQIRKFGDMNSRQTQGLEHIHHYLKMVGAHATNRKQGQRMKTMLGHTALSRAAQQQDEVARRIMKAEAEADYKKAYRVRKLAKFLRLEATKLKLEAGSGLLINSSPAVELAVEP